MRPPRRIDIVSPAPTAPTALTAGVPTSSETNSAGIVFTPKSTASSGDSRVNGRPVVSQCAAIFTAATLSSDKGESAMTSSEPSSKSAWNSRSSASSAASTAAIHNTPAAMRASRLRSGPTPSGTKVATPAKNASASIALPPARAASRTSRRSNALMRAPAGRNRCRAGHASRSPRCRRPRNGRSRDRPRSSCPPRRARRAARPSARAVFWSA